MYGTSRVDELLAPYIVESIRPEPLHRYNFLKHLFFGHAVVWMKHERLRLRPCPKVTVRRSSRMILDDQGDVEGAADVLVRDIDDLGRVSVTPALER